MKLSDNIELLKDSVRIIDQSLLPNTEKYLELREKEELWEAIHSLRVRGAPAIGIFAAYAVYVLCLKAPGDSFEAFYEYFAKARDYLDSARPTAVNLSKMLWRMDRTVRKNADRDIPEILSAMREEALSIHREDIEMCRRISAYGLSLLKDGDCVLTHCNAGELATSRYGTGLGPLFLAKEKGMNISAFCDETRPLLQGARLTTYELHRAGIDCTLICDNMASIVMSQGKINAVLVGCDRCAKNGDCANKIGTSGLAIIAKHYGVPVYFLLPVSTVDPKCETGDDIVIEERDGREISEMFFEKKSAPEGVKSYNPAFDVTKNELITAIITDRGIWYPPFRENYDKIFGDKI